MFLEAKLLADSNSRLAMEVSKGNHPGTRFEASLRPVQ